jgi:hypothetical protein
MASRAATVVSLSLVLSIHSDNADLRDVCDASDVHDVPVEKNETRRLL